MIGGNLFRHLAEQYPEISVIEDKTRQQDEKAWLEAALADGVMIQEPDSLEKYSGQFKLRMPRSLHRALAEHSQQEGISMNQYCVYLLAKNDALHAG